jgi:hypothetical protein
MDARQGHWAAHSKEDPTGTAQFAEREQARVIRTVYLDGRDTRSLH